MISGQSALSYQDNIWPSGIYGLVNLDGEPIDPVDAQILGLDAPKASAVFAGRDCALPDAVSALEEEQSSTVMVGWFSEPDDLVRQLRLPNNAPRLMIARAALAVWGAQMPAHALGEYTLLHWTRDGGLQTISSAPRRDRLFFARVGNRVALAPDVHRLSSLHWVGRRLDPAGYLFTIAQYPVREQRRGRCFLAGIRELAPGDTWTCRRDRDLTESWPGWREPLPPRFAGDIQEAVGEAEALLRSVVSSQMSQGGRSGVMLSGGLDSALLAWLVTDCGGAPPCLTSVAPEGSALADEWAHAGMVCAALGLRHHRVVPDAAANPYTPVTEQLTRVMGPPQVIKAHLYEAFTARAADLGLTTLFDGCFGELTLTNPAPFDTPIHRLRQFARRLVGRGAQSILPSSLSFVRLAPAILQHLPEAVAQAWRQVVPPEPLLAERGKAWYFPPGESMRMALPTQSEAGAIRRALPFRDVRLLRLFSSFPTDFLQHQGMNRAPARIMLLGRLPEAIRLQRKGLPFSPDHLMRLRRMAPAALALLPVYRQAGLAEWFDLDWLDAALQRAAAGRSMDIATLFSAQVTAMNAEFLYRLHAG